MNSPNRKSKKEWEVLIWENFVSGLSEKSKEEIKSILGSYLSRQEKKNVVYRLSAIDLLKEGKSYREIGQILWLSPQTISAIKKSSVGKMNDYKSYRSATRQKKVWSGLPQPQKPEKQYRRRGIGIMDAWDLREYRSKVKPKFKR